MRLPPNCCRIVVDHGVVCGAMFADFLFFSHVSHSHARVARYDKVWVRLLIMKDCIICTNVERGMTPYCPRLLMKRLNSGRVCEYSMLVIDHITNILLVRLFGIVVAAAVGPRAKCLVPICSDLRSAHLRTATRSPTDGSPTSPPSTILTKILSHR